MLLARGAFELVQSFHVGSRVLTIWQIRRDSFCSRQTFGHQNFAQTFPVDFNNHIISALAAAAAGGRPSRPDYERFLQKLLCPLLRLFTGFHCFIERDAKIQTLIVRPVALPKIGLGRVDVVKPRGKLLVAAADPKTIAIIVRRST